MKVKYCSLMRIWITLLIIMNTSLTQIGSGILGWFANIYHITIITALSSVLMSVICLFLKSIRTIIRPYSKFVDKLCLYLLFVIVIQIIYTSTKYSLSLSDFLYTFCTYSYLLLCYPLIYIAVSDNKDWINLLKCIVLCFVLSIVLRWGVAQIYNFTGNKILPDLMIEYASENWIRNERIRIVPPCFIMIIIPIVMYLVSISKRSYKKYFYCFFIVITFTYCLRVYQSRSVLVYLIVICYTIYMLKKKSLSKKMLAVFVALIACTILINTSYVSNFIDSFSSKGLYAGSTTARKTAIVYYADLFYQNPICGVGALWSGCAKTLSVLRGPIGNSYLEDLGILGGIFKFGIIGLLLYLMMLIRMVRGLVYIKKNSNRYSDYRFILLGSLFVAAVIFPTMIDWFYGVIAFGTPFMVTIFEYYVNQVKNNN